MEVHAATTVCVPDCPEQPCTNSVPADETPPRFRLLALAALTAILIGLSVVLAVPFLPALTWAVALAIMAWPVHRWVARRVSRPGGAAAISTMAVVVLLVIPGLFVSFQLAREAAAATDQLGDAITESPVRDRLNQVPSLQGVVAWADRLGVDIEQEARKFVGTYTQGAVGFFQGSVAAAMQFLAMLFILYYVFRDRGELVGGLREVLPLTRPEADRVFRSAADSVHANLYATLVTSTIDGVSGGLVFWALGLPAPILWGVVMFVLAVLPVVGTGLVWVPAAVYLGMEGRWGAVLALTAWGLTCATVVDNFLHVRLAGARMRMHPVPALIAFLGGLAVFGLSGIILGPAILAVTVAILQVWRRREATTAEAAAEAAPG